MRRWLRSLERSSRGELIAIPQADGSVSRFGMEDFAEAYVRNCRQREAKMDGKPEDAPRAHPVQEAMLLAAVWRPAYETYTDGLTDDIGPIPDLSEP